WVKVNGPGGLTITNSGTATPNVIGVTAGTYVFRLTVSDDHGATDSDEVKVTVLPAPAPVPVPDPVPSQPVNIAPIAAAGDDQTITYPSTTAVLNAGSSYDQD